MSEKTTTAGNFDPRLAIEALRILTRADQGDTSVSAVSDRCRFDQLLTGNAKNLEQKLETDPDYSVFKLHWMNDRTIEIPFQCAPRWQFVLYCLKTLYLLQESIKANIAEYKKHKPENIRPSGAPPVSPDTLSFEEKKVVLTAVQFVVCLGISPNLEKGVGIPIEMRSEFSKLIQVSCDEGEIKAEEKQWRLYLCLKVFISCIFTPSLGSVILSRHLTDILAGLLQLTHSLKLPLTETSSVESNTNETKLNKSTVAQSDATEINNQSENKQISDKISGENCSVIDSETADKAIKVGTDFPPASAMTPASVVDHVRQRFQEAEKIVTKAELQNTVEIKEDKHELKDDMERSDKKEKKKPPEVNENDADKTDKQTEGQGEDLNKLYRIDVEFCEGILEDLIGKVYPPLLVKTLLLLQGGPRTKKPKNAEYVLPPAPVWLRKICGEQLTVILMKPKGVQSVLRGMLDSPGQGQGMSQASDWRKCDAVAKVIGSCPLQSLSVESYYKKIGPQILEILHIPDKLVAKQFLRVACSTIASMSSQHPELTNKYIIQPLIGPLLRCTENTDQMPDVNQMHVLVDEAQLSSCVEDCHRVFVSGITGSPQLIQYLQPVMLTLFQLLLFIKQGVSALKTACHELIVCYLKQTDVKLTMTCLELMAFQTTQKSGCNFVKMHQNVIFSHGSSGGVVAIYQTDREIKGQSQDVCIQCIVDLLKDLQNDGTAGEFLIYMLQELTAILRTEVEGDSVAISSSNSEGDVLMKIESDYQLKEEQFYRKLMVLNLLASVCEALGPSCIKSTENTLKFIRATLERAVQVCKATEDPVFEVFENETLTMAMGLLTAILTGAMQVTSDDRVTMENLLPLLHDISDNHPESSIQEMASDLRIAIATHGAVWSEVMKSNVEDFKELKSKIQQTVDKQKPLAKQKPLVEVISETVEKVLDKNIHIVDCRETCYSPEDKGKNTEREIKNNTEEQHQKMPGKENLYNLDKKGSTETENVADKVKKTDKTGFNLKNNEASSETVRVNEKLDNEIDKSSAKTEAKAGKSEKGVGDLEEAFKELCDPLLPVRGHGLIRLTRLVQRRGKEAYDKKDIIMKIFEENLDHTDSYMYLSSVNGLAAMAEIFPDLVVPRICEQFGNIDKEGKKRSSELRMKLGEIMVKASRCLGDTVPKYKDLLINTVLSGARDPDGLVRASSLSNLGEICKLLHFSLGNIVNEVFLCCKSLLKSDSDPEVRKAAAVALTLLLQGLGHDILKVLDSVLLDLYRLLKQVMASEKEEVVRLHANLALNELEDNMKDLIFPKQKLEKRIRVLDME